jgi:hypothetical protein
VRVIKYDIFVLKVHVAVKAYASKPGIVLLAIVAADSKPSAIVMRSPDELGQ